MMGDINCLYILYIMVYRQLRNCIYMYTNSLFQCMYLQASVLHGCCRGHSAPCCHGYHFVCPEAEPTLGAGRVPAQDLIHHTKQLGRKQSSHITTEYKHHLKALQNMYVYSYICTCTCSILWSSLRSSPAFTRNIHSFSSSPRMVSLFGFLREFITRTC